MASTYHYFSGKCKWAMLNKPDSKYNDYKINVYLDEPSKVLYLESGLQMKTKADEDGEFITFRRPVSKIIKQELAKFDPPIVTSASDGSVVTDLLGNGSEVVIKVLAYDTIKGKGHRLEAVQVTKLVPYIPKPRVETSTEAVDSDKTENRRPF